MLIKGRKYEICFMKWSVKCTQKEYQKPSAHHLHTYTYIREHALFDLNKYQIIMILQTQMRYRHVI